MSLILDDDKFLSSTPIKKEPALFEQSVEDLLQVIDNNISSASLNEHNGSSSFNSQDNEDDEISPIKPLNLKQQVQQQGQSISSLLASVEDNNELMEKVMEDIPRAPSFDELDFNTRVNRTSSLSKLSGPRQMSNSALRRTFSNRASPNKSPQKSIHISSSVDNSPSKKSVCFEESPPKILEYDELTPEHSDESELNDTFESKWQVNNLSTHPLPPPPPPKHIISTPSPQKETSLGSSDDSQDFNLTKEDIQSHRMSLEQKLDLVLNDNEISERAQYDESYNGSGSPSKLTLTKEEQEIIYSIKNKDQIEKDEALSIANAMFEEDIRNTPRDSKMLQLDPVLKRRGSSSSLADDERELVTKAVSSSEKAIILEDGLRNVDVNSFNQSVDDVISQSTQDSFASATEIIEDSSLEIINQTREVLPSKDSTNSISTLQGEPKGHKKSNSISDSIHNGLNFIGSIISGSPTRAAPPKDIFESDSNKKEIPDRSIKEITIESIHADEESNTEDNEVILPTEEEEIDAIIQSPEAIDQDPIVSQSNDVLDPISIIENDKELMEENFELLPPISLPDFDTSANETSLSFELKENDVFSTALKDVRPSSADNHVEQGNEVASDNEEIVEGYRSLSPKKTVISPPARSISPPPSPLFGQDDDEVSVPEIQVPFVVKPVSDAVETIKSLPKIPQDEVVLESEQVQITPNPLPTKEFPDFKEEAKDEEQEEIEISKEIYITSTQCKEEPSVEQFHLPAAKFEQIPIKEETTLKIPPEEENIEEHEPLDEEFNYENVEVTVEDEYRSLNPSVHSSPVKGQLPSYNSSLFHDKEPVNDINDLKKPLDYISIWHSQPAPTSPDPQYSIRKKKKPKKVMKLLAKGLKEESDSEEEDFELTIQEIFVKKEQKFEIPKDSFITRSVSRSSFITLDTSRRSSLVLKQQIEHSKSSSFIKQESEPKRISTYYDSYETSQELSGINLPDIDSSDFGNAFNGWDISATETNNDGLLNSKFPSFNNTNIKSIWGSNNDVGSSAPPVTEMNHKKIQSIIGENADTKFKSQKFSSEVIVGNGESLGVDIEFDQDSQFDIFNDEDENTKKEPASTTIAEEVKQTTRNILEQPNTFKLVEREHVEKRPIKSDMPMNIEHVDESVLNKQARLVSGASQASGFDLNYEFDRLVQLQDRSYAVHENGNIIRASSDLKNEYPGDLLDETELNQPYVPDANDVAYQRTHVHGPRERVRTPLTSYDQSKLNSIVLPKHQDTTDKTFEPRSYNRITSTANSENEPTEDSAGDAAGLEVKKRTVSEIRPVQSRQSLAPGLPINGKGRLYIHLNLLRNIQLDEIKTHKATFKLYLDNGKHKISTPKYELGNSVNIDKEFEMAVEEDMTDLHLTLKVNYFKPENELVEVIEKVPINNPNRLSRLLGVKQRFKREKKFVSRKREVDHWDHQFATDGSFGKNKITFDVEENEITGQTKDYSIELFNEWTTREQSGKSYKLEPYLIGKLDVTMLYIPRISPLETLPPSIKIARTIVHHINEQKNIKYEGYLYQEGGDCELWKRRFFKIEGTKLIAHHETSRKPRAQINLLKVTDVIHSGKKKLPNKRNVTEELLMGDTFKLVFKNGEIISFNAETKDFKNKWIQILEKIVEYNKFNQPWSRLLVEKSSATTSS